MIIPSLDGFVSTPWLDAVFSWLGQHWSEAIGWISEHWKLGVEWLAQPHMLVVMMTWAITFTLVSTFIMSIGLDRVGIAAGSLAAAFQSFMYGAFTPAGGVFATLTSMAMLGTLRLPVMLFASLVATGIAAIVWGYGVGR